MTDEKMLELAQQAGLDREHFANPDCPCAECNWLRGPLLKFGALVRREALEEAAQIVMREAFPSERARFGVAADAILALKAQL